MTKAKILVADNDKAFLESFAKYMFNPELYEVVTARNPEEARKKLEENLIHLAIVDVRLRNDDDKNDISGFHLCKNMDPTIARILLTRYTGEESWELVRDAMKPTENRHRLADGFFSKAEDRELISKEMQRVLDEEFEIIPRRRIAVLTSGGDAPGMNAAIWAVVRTAMNNGIEVMGVQDGYKGLVLDKMRKLRWNEVGDIIENSGTILGVARYDDFKREAVRQEAIENLNRKHISGLIVIGGDGSMKGAQALANQIEQSGKIFQTIAIPGTIDNDLLGTDMSLGAASAADAMVKEMRNMMQPARALRRIFVCEVMGACCGYLALQSALGIGADAVMIPETLIEIANDNLTDPSGWKDRIDGIKTRDSFVKQLTEIVELLEAAFAANKRYGFVVLAEGVILATERRGRLTSQQVKEYLTDAIAVWCHDYDKPDVREQKLGYTVRGARPSRFDVWLGAQLGTAAVQCLLEDKSKIMVGWMQDGSIEESGFDKVVKASNRPPREIWNDRPRWKEMLELQKALACPPKLRERLIAQGNRYAQS